MRHQLIFFIVLCLSSRIHTKAFADPIPDAILIPYQASQTEMANKNFKASAKHAKIAWEKSEELLGDSETTSNLAYNYALLAVNQKQLKLAATALERSADLAIVKDKASGLIRLRREETLATLFIALDKRNEANTRINKALKDTDAYDVGDSLPLAKLYVHKARLKAKKANSIAKTAVFQTITKASQTGKRSATNRIQWRSANYAQNALQIFKQYPEAKTDEYRVLAHKMIGFAHERDKDWLEATLSYQRAINIQKAYRKFEDEAFLTTIGRWSNARMHVLANMGEAEAISKGLAKGWPHDETRVDYIAKPIKRVPPAMPTRARSSGFSFMQFDLDDAGKPINIEVMHSWPKKVFDKSSVRAVKKWQYTPRVSEETDEQRQGLRTVITYVLTGSYGGAPI